METFLTFENALTRTTELLNVNVYTTLAKINGQWIVTYKF